MTWFTQTMQRFHAKRSKYAQSEEKGIESDSSSDMHKARKNEVIHTVFRRRKTQREIETLTSKGENAGLSAVRTATRAMDLTIHDLGTGENEVREESGRCIVVITRFVQCLGHRK